MDLTIRLAQADDLAQLLQLYRLLDVSPRSSTLPIERAQERFAELTSNPRHGLYVAEAGQRVIGTFALVFVGGLPHGARDSCIVEDVVVAQDVQGLGIGKRMMRFAMEQCAEQACYKLVLSSHLQRGGAHRFYEGLGFRKHGFSFLIDFPTVPEGTD